MGVNAPRPPAESAAAATASGNAVTMESIVSMPSPTSSVPASVWPKWTAWPWTRPSALRGKRHVCLRGMPGIEPRAMDADDGAMRAVLGRIGAIPRTRVFPCVSGDGGDEGRQAAHAAAVAVEQAWMEAQRGEAAAVDGAGPEVRLSVGAVDGAAAPPKAACRLAGVVGPVRGRCRRSRQGEEGAGLGHGVAERHAAHAMSDEVEEIAMGALGGVGPLAGNAGRRQAHEERAPAGAANVPGGPVPALPAPVGQVGAADLFGALAEGLRDPAGVHAAPPLRPESARVPAGLGLSPAHGRRGGA